MHGSVGDKVSVETALLPPGFPKNSKRRLSSLTEGGSGEKSWAWLWLAAGWQCASVLLTLVSVLSQVLNDRGWHCSSFMNTPMYLCLFLWSSLWLSTHSQSHSDPDSNSHECANDNGTVNECDGDNGPVVDCIKNMDSINAAIASAPKNPNCKWNGRNVLCFLFASFADVLGNALVLYSFSLTSIASVTLLDFFTIPCVFIISALFFKSFADYSLSHVCSVALCVCGIVLLVSHSGDGNHRSGSQPLVGDSLVLCGAFFYSVSNCFSEHFLTHSNWSVALYLNRLSLLGAFFSALIGAVFQRQNAGTVVFHTASAQTWLCYVAYVFALSLYYCLISYLLFRGSSALAMNVSLLTSDAYSLLFAVFVFGFRLTFEYVISMILIFTGVLWFNLTPLKEENTAAEDDNETKAIINHSIPSLPTIVSVQ